MEAAAEYLHDIGSVKMVKREEIVLTDMADGLSPREIAEKQCCTVDTIYRIIRKLRRKIISALGRPPI